MWITLQLHVMAAAIIKQSGGKWGTYASVNTAASFFAINTYQARNFSNS